MKSSVRCAHEEPYPLCSALALRPRLLLDGSKPAVLKLEHASESPRGLVNTQTAKPHNQKSGVGPENLHFYQSLK